MRCLWDRGMWIPETEHDMQDKHSKQDKVQVKSGKKDEKLPENSKKALDEKLDEGVEETFPASDPVSVKITK